MRGRPPQSDPIPIEILVDTAPDTVRALIAGARKVGIRNEFPPTLAGKTDFEWLCILFGLNAEEEMQEIERAKIEADAAKILATLKAHRAAGLPAALDGIDAETLTRLLTAGRESDRVAEAFEAGDSDAFEKAGCVNVTRMSREEFIARMMAAPGQPGDDEK